MRTALKYYYYHSSGGDTAFPACESGVYDVNAQDVINKMVALGATVDETREGYINTCIQGIKTDGNWEKLALLQMFNSPTDASSLFSWTNIYALFPTKSGSLTFTANQGYTGAGGYINTNFSELRSGLLTQNSTTLFAWNLTNDAQTTALFGANPATLGVSQSLLYPKRADTNKAAADLNSASPANQTTADITDASGLWSLKRTVSGSFELWQNDTLIETFTATSISRSSLNYFCLAQNNDGTAAGLSTRKISLFGAASGDLDVPAMYNRLSTYLTQIGAI